MKILELISIIPEILKEKQPEWASEQIKKQKKGSCECEHKSVEIT